MFERFIRNFLKKKETPPFENAATHQKSALKAALTSDRTLPKTVNPIAAPFLTPEQIETFNRDGVICLRNVIPRNEIAALITDIEQQLSNNSQSGTAIDLEEIRKDIWGQTEDGKALTPEDYIQKDGGDMGGEVEEMQAFFEPQYTKSTISGVSKTHKNAVNAIKAILNAVPDTQPSIDGTKTAPKGQFYIDTQQWRNFPNISRAALDSALPAICAELLSTETLQFWGDTTRVKTPNTAQRTTLHQDWAYFPFTGVQSCSVWIALDPCTSENGGPYYIKRSHKWGKIFAANIILAPTQNPLSLYESIPELDLGKDHPDRVSFDVQPGDIIIHHVLILHGAPGNTSLTNMRRALTLRYCGDDIRHFNKPGALETHTITPHPQDGDALNTETFPKVWPKSSVYTS